MRRTRNNLIIPLLLLMTVGACSRGIESTVINSANQLKKITISLANEDRLAPSMLMDVSLNGETMFRGAILPANGGNYLYLNTNVPYKDALLEVVSETGDGAIRASRELRVKDHVWIVVTRIRDFDGPPDLQISVSYEQSKESLIP